EKVHLAQDGIGGENLTAWRVDANDDAFDIPVSTHAPQYLDKFLRPDTGIAGKIRAVVAAGNASFTRHERNVLPAIEAGRRGWNLEIFSKRHLFKVSGIHLILHLVKPLVFVEEAVQQTLFTSLRRSKRTLIDGGADFIGGLLPGLGDTLHQIAVKVVDDAVQNLFGFRTHAGAREHVAEIFVL